jgi:hypothetical protein
VSYPGLSTSPCNPYSSTAVISRTFPPPKLQASVWMGSHLALQTPNFPSSLQFWLQRKGVTASCSRRALTGHCLRHTQSRCQLLFTHGPSSTICSQAPGDFPPLLHTRNRNLSPPSPSPSLRASKPSCPSTMPTTQ